jgi:uncharacterized protein YxjI
MQPLTTKAAVFPNYIGPKLAKVRLIHYPETGEWIAATMSGLVMLTIDPETMVLDSSATRLFQICKDPSSNAYYGAAEGTGQKIWSFQRESVFSNSKFTIRFKNTETGRVNSLEARRFPFGRGIFVEYCDKQVAVIDKTDFQQHETYEMTIAAGLDMTLVVAIALSMDFFKQVDGSKSSRRRGRGRFGGRRGGAGDASDYIGASSGAAAAAAVAASSFASFGGDGGGGFGGGDGGGSCGGGDGGGGGGGC